MIDQIRNVKRALRNKNNIFEKLYRISFSDLDEYVFMTIFDHSKEQSASSMRLLTFFLVFCSSIGNSLVTHPRKI